MFRPIYRPIYRAIATALTQSMPGGFNPASLFADGSKGVVYDNNDLGSFYLDAATPATVNGLVGLQFDKSANLALGAELITNGTFPDTTGWTSNNSGIVSAVGGRLRVQNNVVDYGQAYATFTAVVGQVYAVTSDLFLGTSTSVRFMLGNSVGSGNAFGENFGADTTGIVRYVVANATTMYITVQCNTVNDTAYVEADNISVKAIAGNHRYQTTTGSKPVLRGTPTGANLVTNGDFASGTGWTAGSGWAITGGKATHTAGVADNITQNITMTAGNVYRLTYTVSGLTAGNIGSRFFGGTTTAGATRTANGTYVEYLTAQTGNGQLAFVASSTFDGSIDDVDLRDVSAGQVTAPYGLQYDGVDDFMQTAAVDFTATDKMFVCAGVRKLSDAASGVVSSLGDLGATNGSYEFRAPWNAATANIGLGMRGNAGATSGATYTTFTAPVTKVYSFALDYALGANAEISARADGVGLTPAGTDSGAGPFANAIMYFGRRAGVSLPYNGLDFGLVICGKTLTSNQISSTERYIAQRTGIVL